MIEEVREGGGEREEERGRRREGGGEREEDTLSQITHTLATSVLAIPFQA